MVNDLEYDVFDSEFELCKYVNDNKVDVVSIVNWNKFVLFYREK